jgi:hypothetical protein
MFPIIQLEIGFQIYRKSFKSSSYRREVDKVKPSCVIDELSNAEVVRKIIHCSQKMSKTISPASTKTEFLLIM